jgi:predicted metal-dependent phosphoesterase TrpH
MTKNTENQIHIVGEFFPSSDEERLSRLERNGVSREDAIADIEEFLRQARLIKEEGFELFNGKKKSKKLFCQPQIIGWSLWSALGLTEIVRA